MISQRKQRHQARRYAIQALYQYHFNRAEAHELEAQFIGDNAHVKVDWDFFKILVDGIVLKNADLDNLFAVYIEGGIQSVNPVELAILRSAAFELTARAEIPYKVIIDEYIELAKEYGAEEGHLFVNGVLDKLAAQTRAIEYTHAREK